ncbi:hypothetical protein GCM10010094_67310 [Streptomyces flaveus]|uniref:Uncharacterized protein n=1 Tax=Streptomyces flaveus TaxID=66370 RepID=A0A917VMT4_9ACTN|nr:hypothetical protein GCM10010094_67310 [Streptomyces flaveus]
MRTPAQGSASRGIRVATVFAACALALTPWAAQAQAETPWKLALPLSEAASSDFMDVDARSRTDAWAVGRKTDDSFSAAPLAKHWDGRRSSAVHRNRLRYGFSARAGPQAVVPAAPLGRWGQDGSPYWRPRPLVPT